MKAKAKRPKVKGTHHINTEVTDEMYFEMSGLKAALRIKANPELARRLFGMAISLGPDKVRELIGPEGGEA